MKVRSQEQDVRYRGKINPALPGLKALDSLLLGDFTSSGKKESKPTSQNLVAKVPISYNPGSFTPSPAPKDKNDGDEDTRPHIRASSIPRPRAVLSSPDNDEMFGSKTRRRAVERTSALKPHQQGQKCKVIPRHSDAERPKTGHEASKEDTNKSNSKGSKGPATAIKVRK